MALEEAKFAGWKQPIPTNLEKDFGEDKLSFALFVLLLLRATSKERVVKVSRGFASLRRGQAVCGREEMSKYFKCSPSTTDRALQRLADVHNKVDIKRTTRGTIVTIKNYDEVTKMGNNLNIRQTTSDQQTNTNKIVESVENEKIVAGGGDLRRLKKVVGGKSQVDDLFLDELSGKFSDLDVRWEWEKAQDWMSSRGRRFRDYRSFLRNWCRRAVEFKSVAKNRGIAPACSDLPSEYMWDPDGKPVRRMADDLGGS
ncbi:MAG: hypothetical protein FJ045_03355 [Crenarchaeota archaeon]|nr:hypothetical protein [Thermoproteota archaeon]